MANNSFLYLSFVDLYSPGDGFPVVEQHKSTSLDDT